MQEEWSRVKRLETYVEEFVELDGAVLVGVDLLDELADPEARDVLLTDSEEHLADLLGVNVTVTVGIELVENLQELFLLGISEVGRGGSHPVCLCGEGERVVKEEEERVGEQKRRKNLVSGWLE